jgi:hypothetical protein
MLLLYPGELYRLLGASSYFSPILMCFFPIKDLGESLVSSIPTDFLYLLLLVRCKKITNVAFVIADPFYKKMWAGVPPLM